MVELVSNGYKLLLRGLVFILIDIRIETIDILPDFIGYIIIVTGLGYLINCDILFGRARTTATLLVFHSFPNFFAVWDVGIDKIALFPMTYQLLTSLVHLFMVYFILEGTCKLALKNDDLSWAMATRSRLNMFVFAQLILLMIYGFLLNVDYTWLTVLSILLVIIIIIIDIVIIVFMKKTEYRTSNWES
jgi:hypothetical protein